MTLRATGRCKGWRASWVLLGAVSLGGCSAPPLVTVADEPAHHAWWLRASFHPRGVHLRGIPVRVVDDGWCAIDELAPSHFRPHDDHASSGSLASGGAYAVPGPAVRGRSTQLVLAVFRACTGSTGTAMLLVGDDGGAPAVLDREVLASPASYAELHPHSPRDVRVVFCRECDVADRYVWDAASQAFVPQPDVEDAVR